MVLWCSFSTVFSAKTSQQGRTILNNLRNEWRTNEEIIAMMEDLWLDTSGYFPNWANSSTATTSNNSTKYASNSKTTQQGRAILNELKNEWRTEEEIKIMMEDLWLDTSWYFPNSSNNNSSYNSSTNNGQYTSRSCKIYNIEYIDSLWVYTSPNLIKKEYFINIDYLERYIDSKNPQQYNCPNNWWRISTFYNDNSNSSDRYTAPNWKVYFITNQNWSYTSNELSKTKSFWTINELKNYIRDRNPLIYMWNSKYNYNNVNQTINNMRNEIFN